MGLFFKKTKPASDFSRDGIHCRATVEHSDMLSQGSQSGAFSNKTIESVLSGEQSPLRYKVRLRVEPEIGEPYAVTTKAHVPMMKAGWLRAGGTVEVLVDPDDAKHLAIDWNGAHEEGTISAMFADNPLARTALEGAGLDPDMINREAEAARRAAPADGQSRA